MFLNFPPFRLDLESQRLWRGLDEVPLKPKGIALLQFLASNPRRLIPRDELQTAVWGAAHVSDETIRSTLRAVRAALGDSAEAPEVIETVYGRGYRFVAVIDGPKAAVRVGTATTREPTPTLVGRGAALGELYDWFARAQSGQRQVGFVVGEPGIGKTSLVEAFVGELRGAGTALCFHGQCIDRYGESEPFLPLLEALGRMCRQPGGHRWVGVLERYAPTWLGEIPGLLDPDARRRLAGGIPTINRDPMVRELADAIEEISAHQPIVLLLEDLHWSDAATLETIDSLARRTETAKFLLVGTHRPVRSGDSRNQVARLGVLRAELGLHSLCRSLSLPRLNADDAREYLDHRFPGVPTLLELTEYIYERCSGNPLMMVSYADQMVRDGRLFDHNGAWEVGCDGIDLLIPANVREMIEHQIDQLSRDEQLALENASVAGTCFSAEMTSGAAAALGRVDGLLTRVAREHGLIEVDGEERRFAHGLYQEILYERVPVARRRRLHRRLGIQIENEHRDDLASVAAELAMHFERGRDPERAVRYLQQTADIAIHRNSHSEAATLLRRALDLLGTIPESASRHLSEFRLQAILGNCLSMTKGYVDPEVGETFGRAFDLAASLDHCTPELTSVLAGLCGFYELRGQHDRASEITGQQLRAAGRSEDDYDRVVASLSRAIVCFSVGKYRESAERLRECRESYDPERHNPTQKSSVTDPGVQSLGHSSLVLGGLGRLDEARDCSREAIALARRLGHIPSRVLSHFYAMMFQQFVRNVGEAASESRSCLELSLEHGFPFYIPAAMVISGWCSALSGQAEAGVAQASDGVEILRQGGAVLGQPLYLSMLAEAHGAAGDIDKGLAAVEAGLEVVESTGEVASESFLHWVQGELLLKGVEQERGTTTRRRIEDCFFRGITAAYRCGARMQLAAPAVSLARFWLMQGRSAEAKELLERSTGDLTSSFDVAVLNAARSLAHGH